MIKINLLPQKRAKRERAVGGGAARSTGGESGSSALLIGVVGLLAFAAVIFFAVDKPRRDEISDFKDQAAKAAEDQRKAEITLKGNGTPEKPSYVDLQKEEADAKARTASIKRLMSAKVVPAHVLHELSKILTPKGIPTMTVATTTKMAGGGGASDAAKQLQDWEPTAVWLTSFKDEGGAFKLEGGAQTEAAVPQLRKRLAASVHFIDVAEAGGERVSDQASGVSYFRFTITGRLAY
jgi:hypothetical protein